MPLEKRKVYFKKTVCVVAKICVLKGLPASSIINIKLYLNYHHKLSYMIYSYVQSLKEPGGVLKGASKPQPNQMKTTQRLLNFSGVIPGETGKGPNSSLLNYLGYRAHHDSSSFMMKSPESVSNCWVTLSSSSFKLFGLWSPERCWGPFSLCDGLKVFC